MVIFKQNALEMCTLRM